MKKIDMDDVVAMLEGFEVYGIETDDGPGEAHFYCIDCDRFIPFEDGRGANEVFVALLGHDCDEVKEDEVVAVGAGGFTPGAIEPTSQDIARTMRGFTRLLKEAAPDV